MEAHFEHEHPGTLNQYKALWMLSKSEKDFVEGQWNEQLTVKKKRNRKQKKVPIPVSAAHHADLSTV